MESTELPAEPTPTRNDLIGEGRPMRSCIGCAQVDDHPRHSVQVDGPAGLFADWHFDCHRMITGCEACGLAVDTRAEGAVGGAFLQHVLDVGSRQAAAAGQED